MINEGQIRKEYREHEEMFQRVKDELHDALRRMAQSFYQKRRFEVNVLTPRLKKIDSTVNKLKRKKRDAESLFKKVDDQISLVVNDFLGARISCNTKEDVREIAAIIKNNRRFKLVKEEELSKESGYRALHLDMLFEIHWYDDLIYIPVELQIKTHLQTAWGDITHDESYKPENENLKNEYETEFSKHMADMLDVLDQMAITIRQQRLSFVKPPSTLDDEDINITANTLSYKISQKFKNATLLTQQEMSLVIERLQQEGFESLAEVSELLNNTEIEGEIKKSKESLRSNENVTPFEQLYYGALLKNNNNEGILFDAMRKDYGFVEHLCEDCGRPLTNNELTFLNEKTDVELIYFCEDHLTNNISGACSNCGILTKGQQCKNCEAHEIPF